MDFRWAPYAFSFDCIIWSKVQNRHFLEYFLNSLRLCFRAIVNLAQINSQRFSERFLTWQWCTGDIQDVVRRKQWMLQWLTSDFLPRMCWSDFPKSCGARGEKNQGLLHLGFYWEGRKKRRRWGLMEGGYFFPDLISCRWLLVTRRGQEMGDAIPWGVEYTWAAGRLGVVTKDSHKSWETCSWFIADMEPHYSVTSQNSLSVVLPL